MIDPVVLAALVSALGAIVSATITAYASNKGKEGSSSTGESAPSNQQNIITVTKVLFAAFIVILVVALVILWSKAPIPISNANWNVTQDPSTGSRITSVKLEGGTSGIEVSFELKERGWVAIYKKLTPQLLVGKSGVKFSYSGTGSPNTTELKLIENDQTIFEAVWPDAAVTGNSVSQEIQYSDMRCRKTTGRCRTDNDVNTLAFNPQNIDRIDFSFSNKPEYGDIPGTGTVTIEYVEIIR
jgi:F0F1-type ATP synthase membrane subunit c/vacuolar-type H+-ATPase subunit K